MPQFRFSLQRVLDRRLDEEDARRRALAAVEARRRGLEESLRSRQAEIAAGREDWRAGLVGPVDAEALRHNARAALGLVRRAQRTVLELAALEKAIARARADLVEAARARRALELLRERRLAAHLAEESRREQGALDEMGSRIGALAAAGGPTSARPLVRRSRPSGAALDRADRGTTLARGARPEIEP